MRWFKQFRLAAMSKSIHSLFDILALCLFIQPNQLAAADVPLLSSLRAQQWYWAVDTVQSLVEIHKNPLQERQLQFTTLDEAALSNLEHLLPGKKGYIWIRGDFPAINFYSPQSLGLFLGRVTMTDQTWVNGIFVGSTGRNPPNYFSYWNVSREYTIPPEAIEFHKPITILIHIWVDGEGSLASRPFIGLRQDTVLAARWENFWNSTANLMFASIMLIISIYHFILYFRRKKDKENFSFALLNLLSVFYLSNFFITELPGMPPLWLSYINFQKFINLVLFFMLFKLCGFVRDYLRETDPRWVFWVRMLLLIIPVGIILFSSNYSTLREIRLVTQLFLLPPLAYVVYIPVAGLIKKDPDALPLLLGFSPMVVTALLDIFLHEVMKLYNFPYITGFGWQIVLLSFLFLLAGRFARARNEAEDLNLHLENKVKERTEELSQANMQLQQVNSALEEANYRAQRDLKMAEFVQKSFYPAFLPTLEGWDVAYAFEPMSGVSGDLYDFYIDGNSLLGVGLFDVSGHGIASGLVAMLAKSIVYRQFKDGRDIPLGEVMTKIDEKLISEKGNIENYLTGILLRFTDDRVEYVNAGHPDLLYRSGRTGVVKAVESRQGESRGRFIGLEGLSEGYRSLRFPIHSGDTLLVYSDCLVEAKNAAGEDFGNDRIRAALSQAPAKAGAAAVRDYILEQFRAFLTGEPPRDDLTLLVLIKSA
ncbi:PP2C family protein-serine/threonine phosphatase [Gracilinema caldarium]|uniref:Protein serine/threonine phosphatase n=1 Tax=Gracilinema caldarium (strain ATCC 51460 / DSM 7334 / H1) TaxID=744872 RepID=F8F419_GRAC1|nr:SpoIIE family protein phosphatase [Gracilinema caldarium]AEJ20038.1 protein serine/threonine phosphatase [Gracilinema caldarium DSM 7334]